jgi:hypothetical protein
MKKVTKRLLGRVGRREDLGGNRLESFENQLEWQNYSDIWAHLFHYESSIPNRSKISKGVKSLFLNQFFAVHLGRSLINNETFDITKRLVESFPSVTQNITIAKSDRCCEILGVL